MTTINLTAGALVGWGKRLIAQYAKTSVVSLCALLAGVVREVVVARLLGLSAAADWWSLIGGWGRIVINEVYMLVHSGFVPSYARLLNVYGEPYARMAAARALRRLLGYQALVLVVVSAIAVSAIVVDCDRGRVFLVWCQVAAMIVMLSASILRVRREFEGSFAAGLSFGVFYSVPVIFAAVCATGSLRLPGMAMGGLVGTLVFSVYLALFKRRQQLLDRPGTSVETLTWFGGSGLVLASGLSVSVGVIDRSYGLLMGTGWSATIGYAGQSWAILSAAVATPYIVHCYPKLAAMLAEGRARSGWKAYLRGCNRILSICVGITIGFVVFGKEIARLVLGNALNGQSDVDKVYHIILAYLVGASLLSFGGLTGRFLIALGRVRALIVANGLLVTVKLIFLAWLYWFRSDYVIYVSLVVPSLSCSVYGVWSVWRECSTERLCAEVPEIAETVLSGGPCQ